MRPAIDEQDYYHQRARERWEQRKPCPMTIPCIDAHPTCETCRAAAERKERP